MVTLLTLHGPNLNLLGTREPQYYGNKSLEEINNELVKLAESDGHQMFCYQSNAEHELVNRIQQFPSQDIDFIIINPAAFTHTSIALRDALVAVDIPFIEVHLSNVYAREPFRRHSYFSDLAQGVISGLGAEGYQYAYLAAVRFLEKLRLRISF